MNIVSALGRRCILRLMFKYHHQPCNTLFRDGLGLALEPLPRQLILFKVVVCLLPDLSVVVVHPLELSITQQRWLNEVTTNGSHGNMLETEPLLVAELMGGLDLTSHDNVCEYSN